jgi:predicted DNA-binding transcriptional regulator AlpA
MRANGTLLIYKKEVQELLGIGATKFYELVKLADFPKPRTCEAFKMPVYLRSEIIKWAENLPQSKEIEGEKL